MIIILVDLQYQFLASRDKYIQGANVIALESVSASASALACVR